MNFVVLFLTVLLSLIPSFSFSDTTYSPIIPSGSISTSKIADGAVTPIKLNSDNSPYDEACLTYEAGTLHFEWQECSSGSSTLSDNDVTSSKIAEGTITAADMGPDSVNTVEIANDAITTAKILNGTITGSDISDNTIGVDKLDSDNAPFANACAMYSLAGGLNWGPCGGSSGGSGDVVGPASSTNNMLARFDGATGKLLKDGLLSSDDPASINTLNFTVAGDLDESVIFDTSPAISLDSYSDSFVGFFSGAATALLHSTTVSFRLNSSFLFLDDNTPVRWGANSGGTTVSGSNASGELYFATGGTTQQTISTTLITFDLPMQHNYAVLYNTSVLGAGNDTLTADETLIVKTTVTGGGDTATLPTVTGNDGLKLTIKCPGCSVTDTYTISGDANIDAVASKVFITANARIVLFVANSQWYVESESL